MEEKRTKVSFRGKMVEAIELDFQPISEPWAEYKLKDGTIIGIRPVLLRAAKIIGEFDDHGDPVYSIGSQILVINKLVPDDLKRNSEKK